MLPNMRRLVRGSLLLALLPVVLACTNPDTDPCANFMTASQAVAGPFCKTFTASTVTATAGLPAWATKCSNKPSAISKECTCAFPTGAAAPTTSSSSRSSSSSSSSTTSKAATPTSSGPPTTATNACGPAAINALAGYAVGTTGGGSGGGTTVTSCSALSSAAAKGGVIVISGVLNGCGIIDLVSDTTVKGVGSKSGLTNGGFRVKRQNNVIFRNLYMHNPPQSKDLIELQYSTYVWIDHCDFSTDGLTGDKDYYDGLLDITHGTDFVTVSFNKFHDHWKGSLVGHSENNAAEDTGKLHVTYHHNYWSNVNSRLPSIRFGTGHVYSSCFENIPTSGVHSRQGAQVLVESSSFLNTKLAIVTNLDSDVDGYAVERNNIFTNSTKSISQTGSFTPPYSYTVDPASCICSLVKSSAGTGIVS